MPFRKSWGLFCTGPVFPPCLLSKKTSWQHPICCNKHQVFLFVCHRVEIHVAGFRTKSSSNSPSQGAQQPSYLFPSARIVRRGFPKHTAKPGTRGTSLVLLVYSHFGMGGKPCRSHVPLCLHRTRPCTHIIDFFKANGFFING